MTETAEHTPAASQPGPEHRRLAVSIGKWINEGRTVARPGMPSVKIVTSDVYEWAPGGFLVLHDADGLVGAMSGGGGEIIRYDPGSGDDRSTFFDSKGNVVESSKTLRDGVLTWLGPWADEMHRATSTFSDDDRIQGCLHERSGDGAAWEPSMEITLTKVESGKLVLRSTSPLRGMRVDRFPPPGLDSYLQHEVDR